MTGTPERDREPPSKLAHDAERESARVAPGRLQTPDESRTSNHAAPDDRDTLETLGARLGFAGSAAERLLAQAGWRLDGTGGRPPHAVAWSSPSGMIVLAVALDAADVVRDIGRAGRLREAALLAFGAAPREHVTCLFVIQGPADRRAIDQAVVVRRVARDVRVISSDALATLGSLVAGGTLSHAQAVELLRPPSASADETVSMLAGSQPPHRAPTAAVHASLDCPKCRSEVVRAALAAADLGGDRVFLHCRDCGHVWTMKDRRATS